MTQNPHIYHCLQCRNSHTTKDHFNLFDTTSCMAFHVSGMQVPLCIQVYGNHKLDGVVCIDLTIADYFGSVPYYSNQDTSYAFVFNSDLKTLVHPLLPQPTSITNDLTFVNITSLEVNLPQILKTILRLTFTVYFYTQ